MKNKIISINNQQLTINNLNLGFTLIEIIISISIITLLSGMAIVQYDNLSEQKKLDYETKRFVDTLELAKVKAAAGDSSLCTGTAIIPEVQGYSVSLSASSFQLAPHCIVGTPQPVNYQIDPKVEIIVTPVSPINFFSNSSGATTSCVNVKIRTSSKCNYIKVEQSGLISNNACVSGCPCSCP